MGCTLPARCSVSCAARRSSHSFRKQADCAYSLSLSHGNLLQTWGRCWVPAYNVLRKGCQALQQFD